jgi:hypothetical protein
VIVVFNSFTISEQMPAPQLRVFRNKRNLLLVLSSRLDQRFLDRRRRN